MLILGETSVDKVFNGLFIRAVQRVVPFFSCVEDFVPMSKVRLSYFAETWGWRRLTGRIRSGDKNAKPGRSHEYQLLTS